MTSREGTDPDLFDIVTPSTLGSGFDSVTIALGATESTALVALAAALGLEPTAIWRAGWALTLARLAGVERVASGTRRERRRGVDRRVRRPPQREARSVAQGRHRRGRADFRGDHPRGADRVGGPRPSARPRQMCHRLARERRRSDRPLLEDKIDRPTVERLAELLRLTMTSLVAAGARLDSASPLSDAERRLVVETWNKPRGRVPARRDGARAVPRAGGGASRAHRARWDGGQHDVRRARPAVRRAGRAADRRRRRPRSPVALVLERCPKPSSPLWRSSRPAAPTCRSIRTIRASGSRSRSRTRGRSVLVDHAAARRRASPPLGAAHDLRRGCCATTSTVDRSRGSSAPRRATAPT